MVFYGGCSLPSQPIKSSGAQRNMRLPWSVHHSKMPALRSVQGHVWTVPAVQEESDYSAKRSGAVMYSTCFRLEACLCGDAATMAAGRDVIR